MFRTLTKFSKLGGRKVRGSANFNEKKGMKYLKQMANKVLSKKTNKVCLKLLKQMAKKVISEKKKKNDWKKKFMTMKEYTVKLEEDIDDFEKDKGFVEAVAKIQGGFNEDDNNVPMAPRPSVQLALSVPDRATHVLGRKEYHTGKSAYNLHAWLHDDLLHNHRLRAAADIIFENNYNFKHTVKMIKLLVKVLKKAHAIDMRTESVIEVYVRCKFAIDTVDYFMSEEKQMQKELKAARDEVKKELNIEV